MNIGAITDKGLVRKTNQDAIFSKVSPDNKIGLFVIADGMGGHYMGDLASNKIIQEFEQWWLRFEAAEFNKTDSECMDELKEVLNEANSYIYINYSRDKAISGSTIAVLLIYDKKYYMFNVGDTRIYMIDKNGVNLITVDHTLRTELENKTGVTETDIRNNPKRDALTKAVGTKSDISWHETEGMVEGKRFCICTDGIYKFVDDELLKKILVSHSSPQKICDKLVQLVLKAGAYDNYSMYYICPENKKQDGRTSAFCCIALLLIAIILFIIFR